MHGSMAALLGGILTLFGFALGPAPDRAAEIQACKDRCDASESETDRATCRLNCRNAVESKDKPHIIRWTEERAVGGTVPGQDAPSPTKRTVTTVAPSGKTTTTTTETPAPKNSASRPSAPAGAMRDTTVRASPRHRYYFGLVDCQDRCNTHKIGVDRARCKLRCFRQHPGPPPPRTVATPRVYPKNPPASKTAPTPKKTAPAKATPAPAAPAVDCVAQCAGEGSEDDRMTCQASCENAERRKRQPTRIQTRTETPNKTVADPASCRRGCQSKATTCRSSCDAEGSDADTCRLQCDQNVRSCQSRCG